MTTYFKSIFWSIFRFFLIKLVDWRALPTWHFETLNLETSLQISYFLITPYISFLQLLLNYSYACAAVLSVFLKLVDISQPVNCQHPDSSKNLF